jgi:ribonuclease HIII
MEAQAMEAQASQAQDENVLEAQDQAIEAQDENVLEAQARLVFDELDPYGQAKWLVDHGVDELPREEQEQVEKMEAMDLEQVILMPYRSEWGDWQQTIVEQGDPVELIGVLEDELLMLERYRLKAYMETDPVYEEAINGAFSKEIKKLIKSAHYRLRKINGLPDEVLPADWNEKFFEHPMLEALEGEALEKAKIADCLELEMTALKAQREGVQGLEGQLSQTREQYAKVLETLRKVKGDDGYDIDQRVKPQERVSLFMECLGLNSDEPEITDPSVNGQKPFGHDGLAYGQYQGHQFGLGAWNGFGPLDDQKNPPKVRVDVKTGEETYSRAAKNLFGKNVYDFLQPKERITLDSAVGLLEVMRQVNPSLPCYNVILFPFAQVFEGFVTKVMLLRMNTNLSLYQRDHRQFPTEAYVYNRSLGQFIVGRTKEYPVLSRLIKVWKSLRCLENRVTALPDPDLDALATWPQLEGKILEMADLMKDLYRLFVQVSTRDFDYDLFVNDPYDHDPTDVVFHCQTASPTSQKFIPPELLNSSRVRVCPGGEVSSSLARPVFPVKPWVEETAKPLVEETLKSWVETNLKPPSQKRLTLLQGHGGQRPFQTPSVRIGTDESGKGDYFGPLVVAGVYVNQEIETKLRALGLKESKTNSDSRNLALASQIKEIVGPGHFYLVKINPSKYNAIHAKSSNLNDILAWAHAKTIEALLDRENCPYVIVDKFAREELLQERLKKFSQTIEVFQTPRAERDVAVAAASILARGAFLTSLLALGEPYGIKLLKGASDMVDLQIKEIHEKYGTQVLDKLGKLHFKNTLKAGVILK